MRPVQGRITCCGHSHSGLPPTHHRAPRRARHRPPVLRSRLAGHFVTRCPCAGDAAPDPRGPLPDLRGPLPRPRRSARAATGPRSMADPAPGARRSRPRRSQACWSRRTSGWGLSGGVCGGGYGVGSGGGLIAGSPGKPGAGCRHSRSRQHWGDNPTPGTRYSAGGTRSSAGGGRRPTAPAEGTNRTRRRARPRRGGNCEVDRGAIRRGDLEPLRRRSGRLRRPAGGARSRPGP